MMKILVTGGTGYIGSHTVVALIHAGHEVVVLDNFSNSSPIVLDRLATICKQAITFYQGNIQDRDLLKKIFNTHKIDAVMHFAGLKAVGESVREPIKYYECNVSGTMILAEEMSKAGVFNIIFSSSATVYGNPGRVPYTEDMHVGDTSNPYGTSKYMAERILTDIQKADSRWSVILLRYFNPIGAHESGLIGEHPNGIPNNLLPFICQVASGKLPYLSVFGDDYPTPDGTGIRDYIHVMDLADGHLKAMQTKSNESGVHIYNLGTGTGYSVLEIIRAFEQESGLSIPYQIKPRRQGDVSCCYADTSFVQQHIGWTAQHDLPRMMKDTLRWLNHNPNGYEQEKQ
ncbi:UDP-glucose 4-epimerase GalE [Neisseria dentiae]|uniref:UDP-glucose 4-epimerase GalE n=1 Tax=Neisseria dentiae TaxID=194197 RepID=UPI0035A1075F